MVRYIYSFFIGMLFLNLQAYAMVDDMGGEKPKLQVARAVQAIEKVGKWKTGGSDSDLVKTFRKNKTYFSLALELDVGVLDHIYTMCNIPSTEEFTTFDEIDDQLPRHLFKESSLEVIPFDICKAYHAYLKEDDNYTNQKNNRISEQKNKLIAELNEKDTSSEQSSSSFLASAGKRISSFLSSLL